MNPHFPSSIAYIALLLPLIFLNAVQLAADKHFPERKGLGSLQRSFHLCWVILPCLSLVNQAISAYSITGVPLVVSMIAFDQAVMCGARFAHSGLSRR